jgi:hypothetical protein
MTTPLPCLSGRAKVAVRGRTAKVPTDAEFDALLDAAIGGILEAFLT